ncbi:aspartate beta-hydroxylase domain-containing protein 2 isoform X1 [Emydura macquarii macquarii]|uniref:aspartate beta-hydroxylase domain-containing protein 2 isoform X1 n=1 Tax=Emydura macquarii macquarii TaxID=1129001 RepID=UPI00352AA4A2
MVWVPLRTTRTDHLALLYTSKNSLSKMSLEWLMDWSWSLDGLRDFIATGIQSFRDCDTSALSAVACLLVLFVWYCYHVGREQPRTYVTVNSLMQSSDANGLQNGYVYCHSPECVRCTRNDGLNQKLYHNLQEYAKRYSWSGMGRIHKGIREQGRYLNSRPSIQKPEVFFLPDLPTMPYFSRDAQKHDVELLERNFRTILCEFETLYKAFSNCSLPQGWKMNSTPSGEWFTFYLVNQGTCVPRNCRKCPRTYRLLGSLRTCIGNNVFGNACISVLTPGTVIGEHYGPTNIRIRCHLGAGRGVEEWDRRSNAAMKHLDLPRLAACVSPPLKSGEQPPRWSHSEVPGSWQCRSSPGIHASVCGQAGAACPAPPRTGLLAAELQLS